MRVLFSLLLVCLLAVSVSAGKVYRFNGPKVVRGSNLERILKMSDRSSELHSAKRAVRTAAAGDAVVDVDGYLQKSAVVSTYSGVWVANSWDLGYPTCGEYTIALQRRDFSCRDKDNNALLDESNCFSTDYPQYANLTRETLVPPCPADGSSLFGISDLEFYFSSVEDITPATSNLLKDKLPLTGELDNRDLYYYPAENLNDDNSKHSYAFSTHLKKDSQTVNQRRVHSVLLEPFRMNDTAEASRYIVLKLSFHPSPIQQVWIQVNQGDFYSAFQQVTVTGSTQFITLRLTNSTTQATSPVSLSSVDDIEELSVTVVTENKWSLQESDLYETKPDSDEYIHDVDRRPLGNFHAWNFEFTTTPLGVVSSKPSRWFFERFENIRTRLGATTVFTRRAAYFCREEEGSIAFFSCGTHPEVVTLVPGSNSDALPSRCSNERDQTGEAVVIDETQTYFYLNGFISKEVTTNTRPGVPGDYMTRFCKPLLNNTGEFDANGDEIVIASPRIAGSSNRYNMMSWCGYDGWWSDFKLSKDTTPQSCILVPTFFWNWGEVQDEEEEAVEPIEQPETFGWSTCQCRDQYRNSYQYRPVWCAFASQADVFVNTTNCRTREPKPAQIRSCPDEMCPV